MTKTVPRRGQPTKPKADPSRIIEAYNAGVSIHGIVGMFGYSRGAVRRVLRTSPDVQLRDDAAKPKMSREELTQRHQEGWTPRMLADSCGADIRTIHKRLADLGLRVAPRTPELPLDEIVQEHKAGQSMASLARKHGVAKETIARRIAAAGRAPAKPDPIILPLKLADLCRRGMTASEMSKATGITKKTLLKHLAAAGMRAADKRPGREREAFVPEELMGSSR